MSILFTSSLVGPNGITLKRPRISRAHRCSVLLLCCIAWSAVAGSSAGSAALQIGLNCMLDRGRAHPVCSAGMPLLCGLTAAEPAVEPQSPADTPSPGQQSSEKTARSFEDWTRLLQSGTQIEKLEAVRNLLLAGEKAVEPLLAALADTDPVVRAEAIVALGQLAPAKAEQIVPALFQQIRKDDGYVQEWPNWVLACQAIGKFGEAAQQVLEPEWATTDSAKLAVLCIVHSEMGPAAAPIVPKLLALLEKDDDTYRRAAIGALVSIGPASAPAVPLLRKYLYHEDFHTQYWACRALGAIGKEALPAVPDLVDRLKNGAASVRRNAAMALGKLGPEIGDAAIAALMQAVDDPLQPVREQAVLALGRIGPPAASQAREVIEKSHQQRPIFPHSAATWAIWRLGGPLQPLAESLLAEIKEGTYRDEATVILREMGNQAKPVLERLQQASKQLQQGLREELQPEQQERQAEEVANIEATLQELGVNPSTEQKE